MLITHNHIPSECCVFSNSICCPRELGHYDIMLPIFLQKTNATKTPTASKARCCRCGTNKKSFESSHSSCTDNPIYRSWCKCLKIQRAVYFLLSMQNPRGQQPSKSSLKKTSTRKCSKHEFQVTLPKSRIFAELIKGWNNSKGKTGLNLKQSFCTRCMLLGLFRKSQSSTRTYIMTPDLPISIYQCCVWQQNQSEIASKISDWVTMQRKTT